MFIKLVYSMDVHTEYHKIGKVDNLKVKGNRWTHLSWSINPTEWFDQEVCQQPSAMWPYFQSLKCGQIAIGICWLIHSA